ncbi:hypothetical protein B0H17DRAFT_1192786 [Mycena rosella]|uniref:Uncharacterized protein n=1 Tax=Mycena rosella TaxID=1033263 RepID=A0AAD7GVY8_MYCRO|nr:hypothetical protein B0H17DRAFT_1192786 [Mycena rosella]
MSHYQQHDALAANWDPEILAAYMAGIQKGEDSDDAMSSGDSDSEVEFEEDNSMSSVSTAMSDIDIAHPSDIASDDSAFSSEDEFAEDAITKRQTTRRELVLGRPTAAIMNMRTVDLKSMHLDYMKELDDADEELAELTGVPREVLVRRQPASGYDEPIVLGDDFEAFIAELRKRSDKEIVDADKKLSIEQLVALAQALFRKERQIKHLQG